MKKSTIALALGLAFGLAGCLGGGGSSGGSGKLLDSAVEGVAYLATPSGKTGTTDAEGRFACAAGDTVRFTLGGITLGSTACKATVTPLQLGGVAAWSGNDVVVNNLLLFLQSLDDDDDPANGIRIDAAVGAALAGKTLDFTLAKADFFAAFGALLPAAGDAFGEPYSQRTPGDERLALAKDHFEGTLATALGQAETTAAGQDSAGGDIAVTKYTLNAAKDLRVPYPGSIAAIQQDFPHGFFPAAGSGLAFKSRAADGTLTFYGITDRGPNGDAPAKVSNPAGTASKVFPAPGFVPSIAVITIDKQGARIDSLLPIKTAAGTPISGRPLPAGSVGNSGEVPLTDAFTFDAARVDFDANGLDPESLVYDAAQGVFWTSDEYGPFIVKIDATTGRILKKYQPGSAAGDLPDVLRHRRANRGMEGLTLQGGTLHGFLQSPLDPIDAGTGKSLEVTDSSDLDQDGKTGDKVKVRDFARFARWLAFDTATEGARLYAYPLDYPVAGEQWSKNRTGSAKLGDVVALGNGRFLVIEQGADASGAVRNFLMLVEIPADATDIAADGFGLEMNSIDGSTATDTTRAWSAVVPMRKRLLVDLNALGWTAEKAEGLTLVDAQTVALINDNDFGLRSILTDANGHEVEGSPEDCTLDAATGALTGCPNGATGARVTRGSADERPTRLWLLKLPKALTSYAVN